MNVDARWIGNGRRIPAEGYADQPCLLHTDDGAWLCVITTGPGDEGQRGQHIISQRSTDEGRTWGHRADVEPSDGPEASYAVLLKVRSGRIYCFYNHNTDNVRETEGEDGYTRTRVDSLGHYVFKYSDDHGRTWSQRRYEVPVREFACDRNNIYGGKVRFFWNVGRPLVAGNTAYLTLHKVAALGEGFYAQSEGALLRSDNILTEADPQKIRFETLPDGEVGLRTPAGGGRIAEEQNLTLLSDGSLYCVYRSVDGWPVCCYSRDGAHTWTQPQYKTYTPGGRRIKHPRAANFVWRCTNGRFLYWFHNHGGASVHRLAEKWDAYLGRNPAWLCAAREVDSPQGKVLEWSEPEVLLYDENPLTRISYPDLIEDDGRYFIAETQKTIARLHEIEPELIRGLFAQWSNHQVAEDGIALELANRTGLTEPIAMPRLSAFRADDHESDDPSKQAKRRGFSIDLWLQLEQLTAGQIIFDSCTASGQGIALEITAQEALQITLDDGRQRCQWHSDPGMLKAGQLHHIAVIVDAGPRIISFVIDGTLCDGGNDRAFGWGRFSPALVSANGAPVAKVAPHLRGCLYSLRLYDRYLLTSEAVGNWRAGCPVITAKEIETQGVQL